MPKLDEQISTLQNRLTQLKLRQQRNDARKRALEVQRERKLETRRRILVGALVMSKAKEGEIDPNQLRAWLDGALTRTDDRALFNLPALGAGLASKDRVPASQSRGSDRMTDV
jgi:multidrug efflux pump subunit AcrA (membrane-fusion protein)